MKKLLYPLFLLMGLLAMPAWALPFVAADSGYTFYLEGSASGNPFLGVTRFDGLAATSERAGLLLTVNESETALGNGQSRITFDLRANGSLFPVNDETAIFGIGTDGNGYDLTTNVVLRDATVILFDIDNQILATFDDLQDNVAQTDPWNGLFPNVNDALGFGDIDASRIAGISVEFIVGERVNAVPEPGSILLCAIGLAAAGIAMRRRA